MLTEVVVRDLGVIEHASLVLGAQMTALTGETGAGKTMIVEALSLLLGGRAESIMVRTGADEARVDGRFDTADGERILSRVVSRSGRSRAYVDGHPVTVAQLAELGSSLVDVHGQHGHQSLLSAAAQRSALDEFGRVDLGPLAAARRALRDIDDQLAAMGGDERSRMRELDLLRFQFTELDGAGLDDPAEDARLTAEEELLASAVSHREAATVALEALRGESGVRDSVGAAVAVLHRRSPFESVEQRLVAVLADIDDVIADLRAMSERIDEDPERLAAVRTRRQQLKDLGRKYGEDIDAMIAYRDELAVRIAALESHEARAAELERNRASARAALHRAAAAVKSARMAAAEPLAVAVQKRLGALAMPKARLDVQVGAGSTAEVSMTDASTTGGSTTGGSTTGGANAGPRSDAESIDDGSEVCFMLAANPGAPLLPLAKVASGGELARTMLALRLALLEGRVALGAMPDTLVFDEVDAGIGGAAALAVGDALSELGRRGQVLVVTHLAQVAAKAHQQVVVAKTHVRGSTSTTVTELTGDDRVAEIARMLGGSSTSVAGRRHAEELLATQQPSAPGRARKGGNVRSRG